MEGVSQATPRRWSTIYFGSTPCSVLITPQKRWRVDQTKIKFRAQHTARCPSPALLLALQYCLPHGYLPAAHAPLQRRPLPAGSLTLVNLLLTVIVVAGLGYPLPLLSPSHWPTCKEVELQIHVTVMKLSANTPRGGSGGMLPKTILVFKPT